MHKTVSLADHFKTGHICHVQFLNGKNKMAAIPFEKRKYLSGF
jgi:hypothetical protein